jgi:hypothetical protein
MDMMKDLYEPLVGKCVLVETVTLYFAGKLEAVGLRELALINAAYIGNTGRKKEAFETNEFSEVQPLPTTIGDKAVPMIINRNAITAVIPMSCAPNKVWVVKP